MVYSNDFVVCILVDGKPTEERADNVVPIPFGTEYTIRLRNKNSRTAVAKVFVDNENVSEGGIVVYANDYVDLERPTADGKNRKFKFVSTDSPQAEDAGKAPNKDTNGVIRVEWQLEREPPKVEREYIPYPVPWPQPWRNPYPTPRYLGSSVSCSTDENTYAKGFAADSLTEGCTVQGSQSKQTFRTINISTENTTTVITLVLRGYHIDSPAKVLMDDKYCEACGAKRAKRAKFCGNCGKALPKTRRGV